MKHSLFSLILLFLTFYSQAGNTGFSLSNSHITRSFEIKNNRLICTSLRDNRTNNEYLLKPSQEFSVMLNNKQYSSDDFEYQSHELRQMNQVKSLTINLKGSANADLKGIEIKLNYWLYDTLTVVRKNIEIINLSQNHLAIENLDTEHLNLDVSGVHVSEIHTGYGHNTETAPYAGKVDDAAILMYNDRKQTGLILGNEAISVMKSTRIYTSGYPIVQIGLAQSNAPFPFKKVIGQNEIFRSPATFICAIKAPNWQEAYEGDFAIFLRKYAGIKFFQAAWKPLLMYNTWRPFRTEINDSIIHASADALSASGTDLFIIDCGWYDMMGSYKPDIKKFPAGMEPICNYIRNKGMKAGMWFSFATANVNSQVVKDHPDWTLKDANGNPMFVHDYWGSTLGEKCYTMSMDSPWYDYIFKNISGYVRSCGLSYIKLDLAAVIGSYQTDVNISGDYQGGFPKAYPDRASSYYAIFEKTLQFCDDLNREFPDLLIDYTYETHGRHNGVDYALLQHAHYDWITNYELDFPDGPISIRQMRFNRARTMPVSTLLIGNQNMLNKNRAIDEYTYLSVVSATGILVGDVRKMTPSTVLWYKKWNNWFTGMNKKYDFTSYYQTGHIFDYPTRENWDGCYRFNTEKQGGVLFFYRNNSSDKVRIFKIHCVNEKMKYKISAPFNNFQKIYSGYQLKHQGLKVKLGKTFSAAVFAIEPIH